MELHSSRLLSVCRIDLVAATVTAIACGWRAVWMVEGRIVRFGLSEFIWQVVMML